MLLSLRSAPLLTTIYAIGSIDWPIKATEVVERFSESNGARFIRSSGDGKDPLITPAEPLTPVFSASSSELFATINGTPSKLCSLMLSSLLADVVDFCKLIPNPAPFTIPSSGVVRVLGTPFV